MVFLHDLRGSYRVENGLQLDSFESSLKITIDFLIMPEGSCFCSLQTVFLDFDCSVSSCIYCHKGLFRAPNIISELDLLIVI